MTYLVNDPKRFPAESLRGVVAANSDYVQSVRGGVVRLTETSKGQVSVVVGGGAGHYPAFAGWVGPGMEGGAVCGNIFASPSPSQAESVARAAEDGAGTLLLFGSKGRARTHGTASIGHSDPGATSFALPMTGVADALASELCLTAASGGPSRAASAHAK
jgi:dihydroxyacetone kinase